MATTVINTVSHYLISKEEDKKIHKESGPGPPSRPPGPTYLYSVPPLSSALPCIYVE